MDGRGMGEKKTAGNEGERIQKWMGGGCNRRERKEEKEQKRMRGGWSRRRKERKEKKLIGSGWNGRRTPARKKRLIKMDEKLMGQKEKAIKERQRIEMDEK